MCAKRRCDEDGDDQPTGPSWGLKRCRHCHTQHDEKYDAIFELLKGAEEHSKQIEMHAEENQREAFMQAQQALKAYNTLLE